MLATLAVAWSLMILCSVLDDDTYPIIDSIELSVLSFAYDISNSISTESTM